MTATIWKNEEDRMSNEYYVAVDDGNPYEKPPVCCFVSGVPKLKKA
ncbi:hypothetical protein KO507_16505 [Gilvimarinus agarilyticus]|nr:hypothetical protein [Gilvimarinus sp. 2_MG-2023]MBU2887368.1 hypothetical protein [Gilvimarinus agarilyticus]